MESARPTGLSTASSSTESPRRLLNTRSGDHRDPWRYTGRSPLPRDRPQHRQPPRLPDRPNTGWRSEPRERIRETISSCPMIPLWGIEVNRENPSESCRVFYYRMLTSGWRYVGVITRSTSHTLSVSRFVAGLAAAILLIQVAAPAATLVTRVVHDDKPAHSAHHPGCPFDGKANCPHHKAPAGEPSFVQCGDGDGLVSGPAGATLRLLASKETNPFRPPAASTTPAATVRPILRWQAMTPETPPPRVPDSL